MDPLLRRRHVLGLASVLALEACRKTAPPTPPTLPSGWETLEFPPSASDPDGQRAELYAPTLGPNDTRPRLLVALHGRGESGRGLGVGAASWRVDYGIQHTSDRLRAAPLTRADFRGLVTDTRLEVINQHLAIAPFEGLALACPYTPDLADRSLDGSRPFARFVTERLVARATERLGGAIEREGVGIDGVSMGGRLALLVGLAHPEVFGSVGALQPAIRAEEAGMIADLAYRAMAKGPLRLLLASSKDDPFLPAVRALREALGIRGLPHRFIVSPGPHDYVYNRGPGGVEMLLFHERAARGLQSV